MRTFDVIYTPCRDLSEKQLRRFVPRPQRSALSNEMIAAGNWFYSPVLSLRPCTVFGPLSTHFKMYDCVLKHSVGCFLIRGARQRRPPTNGFKSLRRLLGSSCPAPVAAEAARDAADQVNHRSTELTVEYQVDNKVEREVDLLIDTP